MFESDRPRIINFVEGEGEYRGTLGKVIVDVDGIAVTVMKDLCSYVNAKYERGESDA